jgi:hypothetical protein
MDVHINETLKEVCNAINSAEATLREHIKLYYHNANEEHITFLLYGHIKHRLREASHNKSIEKAFLKDLKSSLGYQPNIDWDLDRKLHQEAEGLIADIVLHNKRQEGKTGGDFGLIIVHPQIKVDDEFLEIKKGVSSGLLCQAKLQDKDGKWGPLTKNQRATLSNPDHLYFTSLALYSFLDGERTDLDSIAWKLCRGTSLPQIQALLKNGPIEKLATTRDIITSLGRKEIGTEDQNLIETVISPSVRQHLEIRIYRPKDKKDNGPKQSAKLRIRHKEPGRETVCVKLYHT